MARTDIEISPWPVRRSLWRESRTDRSSPTTSSCTASNKRGASASPKRHSRWWRSPITSRRGGLPARQRPDRKGARWDEESRGDLSLATTASSSGEAL